MRVLETMLHLRFPAGFELASVRSYASTRKFGGESVLSRIRQLACTSRVSKNMRSRRFLCAKTYVFAVITKYQF